MKKVCVFLFVLTLILGMATTVSAANISTTNTTDKWEEYLGVTYYSFDEDEVGEDSSTGFFLAARKWNSEKLAFGGEWDYTTYDISNDDVDLNGFLGTITYKVSDNFLLDGALGVYRVEVGSESESDFGIKLGAESKLPINDNMALVGRAAYRIVEIDDSDFGGLELSLALTNKF